MNVKNLVGCLAIFGSVSCALSVLLTPAHSQAQDQADVQEERRFEPRFRKNFARRAPEPRSFEFRTAPIAMLYASWLTLDASYRFTDSFAAGPAFVSYSSKSKGNMVAPSWNGHALGAQANYYFNSVVRDTWYFGTHAYYEDYESYPHGMPGYEEHKGLRAHATLGHQWRWTRTILQLGFGWEVRAHEIVENRDPGTSITDRGPGPYSETTTLPFLEFKLGFEI